MAQQLAAAADSLKSYSEETASDVIDRMTEQCNAGSGLVPLIGAGFSVAAGSPVTPQLHLYLQRCISLALGVDVINVTLANDGDLPRRWNPRRDSWPPLSDPRRPLRYDWFGLLLAEWNRKRQDKNDRESAVFQEALGAMAEWRTSLLFLSRLDTYCESGDQREIVFLNSPIHKIIDDFFVHVTTGRSPALCHQMLAQLSRPLRMNPILTSNFDELIEDAFRSNRILLQVENVQLSIGLPQVTMSGGVPTLIKLHGGRHNLRADYSLDAPASESDRATFTSYLTGRPPNSVQEKLPCVNNLLVMGLSGREYRLNSLIEHAWRTTTGSLNVYWLCYSEDDHKRVQALANTIVQNTPSSQSANRRWAILRHSDLGLFLLQLYQVHLRSLPSTCVPFPTTSRLSIPLTSSSESREFVMPGKPAADAASSAVDPPSAEWQRLTLAIYKRVDEIQRSTFVGHRLVIVTSNAEKGDLHGVTSAAADAFFKARDDGVNCVWLDMDDMSGPDDFFEQFLDSICVRTGVTSWIPVRFESDARSRAEEVRRAAQVAENKWLFFINARETPGMNLGHSHEADRQGSMTGRNTYPNGWLDHDQSGEEDRISPPGDQFLNMLEEFTGPVCMNVSIVLLIRQGSREESGNRSKFHDLLLARGDRPKSGYHEDDWIVQKQPCLKFNTDVAVKNATKWASSSTENERFLRALVLMRRSRLLSTFWSDPFPTDDSEGGYESLKTRINELATHKVLRRKPGGFIWLYIPIRNKLREKLEHIGEYISIHLSLVEWYRTVFRASQDPAAAFESVYHSLEAISWQMRDLEHGERLARILEILTKADAFLRDAAPLIRSRGFSRASCRRLTYFIDRLHALQAALEKSGQRQQKSDGPALSDVGIAIQELMIRCLWVMRGIAIEVQEMETAYKRHRELCMLVLSGRIPKSLDAKKFMGEEVTVGGKSLTVREALDTWPGVQSTTKDGVQRAHTVVAVANWWKWLGTLGMLSRNYDKARKSLAHAVERLLGSKEGTSFVDALAHAEDGDMASLRAQLDPLRSEKKGSGRTSPGSSGDDWHSLRLELVKVLERFSHLYLLLEQFLQRDSELPDSELPDSEQREIEQARRRVTACREIVAMLLDCGQSVLNHVESGRNDDRLQSKEVSSVSALLLMHRSVLDARNGAPSRALHSIGLAQVLLEASDSSRSTFRWALLDLHRAEIYLETARLMSSHDDPTRMTFVEYYRQLRMLPSDLESGKTEAQGLEALRKTPRQWRASKANLADAAVALKQAGAILFRQQRNVWWGLWYYHRHLKVIELTLWATMCDTGEAIPYLGLEAAVRGTATVADQLLDESIRMVRLDVYRFATIVDTYANCVLALHYRLGLDVEAELIPRRQEDMHDRLCKALERLQVTIKKRTELSRRCEREEPEKILDYARKVCDRVARVIQLTRRVRLRHGELVVGRLEQEGLSADS